MHNSDSGLIVAICFIILLLVWLSYQNDHDCDERWAQTQVALKAIAENVNTLNSNQTELAKQVVRHLKWHIESCSEEPNAIRSNKYR